MDDRMTTGRRGEQLAAEHLAGLGCELLERNWRCRDGEIDLVVRDGRDLVCVEVRTRRSLRRGHPLESLTPAKVARMRRVARQWRAANPALAGRLRVDAIAIVLDGGAPPELVHLRGLGDEGAVR